MAKGGFSLDDYVDVAERITKFYELHPEGSLTRLGEPEIREVGGKVFVIYTALAHRHPLDPHPAVGTAWEPFPGPTQYTRDSELMNAETAAWGRAIIAAGISSKKIASKQEVRNRREEPADGPARDNTLEPINGAQYQRLKDAFAAAGQPFDLLFAEMDKLGVEAHEGEDVGRRAAQRIGALKSGQAEALISALEGAKAA